MVVIIYRNTDLAYKLFLLLAPIGYGCILPIFMYILLPWDRFYLLGSLMLGYLFPPLGKESVIPMGILLGFHPLIMAIYIAYVDIIVGLFLIWNFDYIKYIPILGKWVAKFEQKGNIILTERKWLRKLAFFGLTLWVIVPFQGTGAVTGSILGRLIGMDKYRIWFAITLGAILGCLFIAYTANLIVAMARTNILYGLSAVAVLILIFVIVYYKRWRIKPKA